MSKKHLITRRAAMGTLAGAAAFGVNAKIPERVIAAENLKNNLKHSACRWCYSKINLDTLCASAKKIGLQSIELLTEKEFGTVKKHGLSCAITNGPSGIARGWNRVEDHDKLVKESKRLLPLVADAGFPNMIVFSGNTGTLTAEEGIENCAKGIKKIMKAAEKNKVTVCMELLNSKVDHKGYQCDHTQWGVQLVDAVGSDRFKLLYDIYHMQIMEGDVIATIRKYKDYIGHYHTGGVPGRNEIDESQELNYPAICKAIVETGYRGFLGQEFIPKRDPMKSLAEAVALCDV
jgi:hydroxypyruvate isomerase